MKRHLIIALIVGTSQLVYGQAPVFSQYYASALYLSPALTGLEKDVWMGMNYRSQWSSAGIPFSTFQFSFIAPLLKPGARPKHVGGVGASFFNDVAGPNREFINSGLLVSGAYNVHLTRYGNNIVSLGLQAGAVQERLNAEHLQWASQYAPDLGYDNSLPGEEAAFRTQVINPLVNIGVMWSYTTRGRLSSRNVSAFSGIVVSNVIPQRSFTGQEQTGTLVLKLHGGISSIFRRKLEIAPNYLVQYQNHYAQVNVGAYFGYYFQPPVTHSPRTKVMIGAWYRLQDAAILSAAISSKSWNLGFSYDSNVSALSRAFGYASAYEVSLAYKIVVSKGFKRFSSPLI